MDEAGWVHKDSGRFWKILEYSGRFWKVLEKVGGVDDVGGPGW